MIPNIQQLIDKAQYDAQQTKKNRWKDRRQKAMDFYNGRTEDYTAGYFSTSISNKVVIGNVNMTKRIIDRISLVYMVEPKRNYTDPTVVDFFDDKDLKMQRLERYLNLLDNILIKPTWHNGKIEYHIIRDFEPHFGDDPLKPIAFTYPLSAKVVPSPTLTCREDISSGFDDSLGI